VDDPGRALAVIRQAIYNEIAGQRFYSDAAFYCIDPWAKEAFATLAREEEDHTRLLLIEYEALTAEGRWIDPETAMASDADVDITRFTFPDDPVTEQLFTAHGSASDVVDRRADDLTALALGIGMEKKAIALYGEQASVAVDAAAQQAYEFLVREETRHYHQLKHQWERLAGRPFEEEQADGLQRVVDHAGGGQTVESY
jgi:rubrerythrin